MRAREKRAVVACLCGLWACEAPAPAPLVPAGLRAAAPAVPAAPALDVPADLRRALEEIESYVSMGFVDDARGVLAEVGPRISAHPALMQRLAELGLELEAPSEMDALLGDTPVPADAPVAAADEPLQLSEDFLHFTPSTALPTAPTETSPGAPADGDGFDIASELGDLFGAFSHSQNDGYRRHADGDRQRLYGSLGHALEGGSSLRVDLNFVRNRAQLPGASVRCPRMVAYCSGVSRARHSASVRVTRYCLADMGGIRDPWIVPAKHYGRHRPS